MNQTIQVTISGSFPSYKVSFSAQPSAVAYRSTQTFTYQMSSTGFRLIGVNLQRSPFGSADELTWAIPTAQNQVILTDVNSDKQETKFGLELIFADAAGNMFSSQDPEILNEGEK